MKKLLNPNAYFDVEDDLPGSSIQSPLEKNLIPNFSKSAKISTAKITPNLFKPKSLLENRNYFLIICFLL